MQTLEGPIVIEKVEGKVSVTIDIEVAQRKRIYELSWVLPDHNPCQGDKIES